MSWKIKKELRKNTWKEALPSERLAMTVNAGEKQRIPEGDFNQLQHQFHLR